jgi:hypothetical protein
MALSDDIDIPPSTGVLGEDIRLFLKTLVISLSPTRVPISTSSEEHSREAIRTMPLLSGSYTLLYYPIVYVTTTTIASVTPHSS